MLFIFALQHFIHSLDLLFKDKILDHSVQRALTGQEPAHANEILAQPVVRHPVLNEVVRSNPRAPRRRADLSLAILLAPVQLLFESNLVQFLQEIVHGLLAVLHHVPLAVGVDHDSGRQVRQSHR